MSIYTTMSQAGLPQGFIHLAQELAEESEGFADVVVLWAEASDPVERTECEIDLFAMMIDRWPEETRRLRVQEIARQAVEQGIRVASGQTQVPVSVLTYVLQNQQWWTP